MAQKVQPLPWDDSKRRTRIILETTQEDNTVSLARNSRWCILVTVVNPLCGLLGSVSMASDDLQLLLPQLTAADVAK